MNFIRKLYTMMGQNDHRLLSVVLLCSAVAPPWNAITQQHDRTALQYSVSHCQGRQRDYTIIRWKNNAVLYDHIVGSNKRDPQFKLPVPQLSYLLIWESNQDPFSFGDNTIHTTNFQNIPCQLSQKLKRKETKQNTTSKGTNNKKTQLIISVYEFPK